jgi:site-specific recombinase XerD
VHAIRQYLGHSSIATSQIYIDEAGDERVMEEVASFTLPRSEATKEARRRLNIEAT